MKSEPAQFTLRRAEAADAAIIGCHRARMFLEMGDLPDDRFEQLREAAERWTTRALASGEYVGWLASPAAEPDNVIAGAGVHLRHVAPHPLTRASGAVEVAAESRHALVLNVFTEPEWRRQGVARQLMEQIVGWAREERIVRLVLHASPAGRSVYEQAGFVPTNEMRYGGSL